MRTVKNNDFIDSHLDILNMEGFNFESTRFAEFHHRVTNDVMEKLAITLVEKLNNVVSEGLDRKGFKFGSQEELEHFIRLNCKKVCLSGKDVFFVNDEPFLEYYHPKLPVKMETDPLRMTATLGDYKFV